jgi:hypothetical protein
MTPVEMILEQLASWQPTGPGPHRLQLTWDRPGQSATIHAARQDTLSSLVNELFVVTGDVADCSAAELTERAAGLAQRITGLAEPLKVYEVDSGQRKALLRSATPTERGGRLSYFELVLSGRHGAHLHRYQVTKSGSPRVAASFPLTHDTIAKVIGEIIG